MLAFRARLVFPIDGPPLRDGVVAIDHDRIVAVGESSSPAIRDLLPAARDLGDVAILPGLINSHTHLEFSDLSEPLGARGIWFPEWIRLIVAHQRREYLTPKLDKLSRRDVLRRSLGEGIEQCFQSAVTAVGDIESRINLPEQSARRVILKERSLPLELFNFLEVIALKARSLEDAFRSLSEAIDNQNGHQLNFKLGISPHAPYTVHPELLRRCVRLSAERKLPVAHHLAESREELMLLRAGRGPFVKLLEDFDAWDPNAIPFGCRPIDYLMTLAKSHRALVIHGNYLDDDEIGFLAAHAENMSVVYCPRTHAYFQHDPYPLAKMIAAGVNVAIGTDSRASNPDLSVLADMRFAAKHHPLVPPATLLRMITANAAQALGRDDEIGTLTPGKLADLAIMQLPRHETADPHELLFDPDCRILATIFRGRQVYGDIVANAPS